MGPKIFSDAQDISSALTMLWSPKYMAYGSLNTFGLWFQSLMQWLSNFKFALQNCAKIILVGITAL